MVPREKRVMLFTDLPLLRRELRSAARVFRERGLIYSAKWSAEQLVGLDPSFQLSLSDRQFVNSLVTSHCVMGIASDGDESAAGTVTTAVKTGAVIDRDGVLTIDHENDGCDGGKSEDRMEMGEEEEEDVILLARSLFDTKEYHCVIDTLESCRSLKALFLRGYSMFLLGEKKKDEEMMEQTEYIPCVNSKLQDLRQLLQPKYESGHLDGPCLYLYGICLREYDLKDEAREVLAKAVHADPAMWCAWKDLAALSSDRDSLQTNALPMHWMVIPFLATAYVELQVNTEALRILDLLCRLFSGSNHFVAQMAIANYNLREFNIAEDLFEELGRRDPHRLENMDIYSNILYVKEDKAKLSRLAHVAHQTDKYRSETCCIVGNYYSLRCEHDKALRYFGRALKLDCRNLSAWTLLGHEFVEMKNSASAISAYRRAVDVNPRDYRAWYGLGQTYEILKLYLYAMFYYRKATGLRPYDARMWCAMAGCYEHLKRTDDAIKCYQRAVANGDREGIALNKLAVLHRELGDSRNAAVYYEQNLALHDEENIETPDTVDALLYLAQYYEQHDQLDQAKAYCARLLDHSGRAKEEAKALLRSIHARAPAVSALDLTI
eukprot:TRINITY_DN858_c0_g1_i1.p1 TRINITY_DN858_c0_g1~~TRINITY_DN858_c0_g1_i1.p1  ORF type:complete len:606 (+),score=101.61 TRINITY_DN858_c0_g1_i1:150-1967(+)